MKARVAILCAVVLAGSGIAQINDAVAKPGKSSKPAPAKVLALKDYPPPKVPADSLPVGEVLVELCDTGLPDKNAWPEEAPKPSHSYRERALGLFRLPQNYTETGIRTDRGNPLFVRAAAVLPLQGGRYQILLRARGATRLTLDGKVILTTPFPPSDNGGHGIVMGPDKYLNLGPTFRFAPPGNREAVATVTIPEGQKTLAVLETIVGGYLGKSRRRPELGETVVAWSLEGSNQWFLATPTDSVIPYTDAGWEAYSEERSRHLDDVDAKARAACRATEAPAWIRKRTQDAAWLAQQKELIPPDGKKGAHPVDRFLEEVWKTGQQETSDPRAQRAVALLETRCVQCHSGTKAKGGLRLDSRQALLKGGDSGKAFDPVAPAQGHLLTRVRSVDPADRMPPKSALLSPAEITLLAEWLGSGAPWPTALGSVARVDVAPICDDLTFLRRVYFDIVGVPPSQNEINRFLADASATRRKNAIDRALNDPRWADHAIAPWLDLLAENPNILNPTLNNTGPFRWWLHEALLDHKPLDMMATELVRMRGSERFGGPAGFGVASQNDAPMATKGVVLAGAFLGVQLKCARCHDAPTGGRLQEDLFSLAAMLADKPVVVPATSSVAVDKLHSGGRKALINVTLKSGSTIQPAWRFNDIVAHKIDATALSPRDRLAALLTSAANERFAEVQANRIWRDLMGRGLVEPPDDWDRVKPSHPELLKWLGRELVRSGYDEIALRRLLMTSQAYQRASAPSLAAVDPLYRAQARRRLAAEQVVDGLFAATGKPMRLEEVSLDIDGLRDLGNSISLGQPRRAWMLTSTSNERDRPSLSLPRIQAVSDVLTAFGWRGARQDPLAVRDDNAEVIQPAILANGTMGLWLTTLSDDHAITKLALEDIPVQALIDRLYLRFLTRKPSPEESATLLAVLMPGYAERRLKDVPLPATKRIPEPYVSWSNHLDPEATIVRQRQEARAKEGDPPSAMLDTDWRCRLENVIWAFINTPEFAHTR